MKRIAAIIVFLILTPTFCQSKISFTFDDGSIGNKPNYKFDVWNNMLLKKLEDAKVEAMFFVTGKNIPGVKGKQLLKSWNEKGHKIGNHTYRHSNYSANEVSFSSFKNDFIKNDAIINAYSNYSKFFRFPYLKEGNTAEKIDSARAFLKKQGYRNGHVTIDASDWYIDSRLLKRLRQNPKADVSAYRAFYLNHIWEKAQFYEELSVAMNGRHINHTLLLHHNLTSALFIDDLIAMFKSKGWEIVPVSMAFKDPIYKIETKYAGESLIYAQARDAGKYKNKLRYPPEDSKYEKSKMDKLGL